MKKSVSKKPSKTAKPVRLAKKTSTTTPPSPLPKSGTAVSESLSRDRASATYKGPAKVCADHQRRTCLELLRAKGQVSFIALDVENGLDVALATPEDFDRRFTPLADYPVERAAKLYIEYGRGLGASLEAMQALGTITTVTKEDIEMAAKKTTARKAAGSVKTEKKAAAKPTEKVTKTTSKVAKTTTAKDSKASAAKTPKAPAEKKERKDRGPTAAKRFQELIMAGKLTDDKIFETVQKEFGLDESKRSYVKWYRNYLDKQGKNPPAAK